MQVSDHPGGVGRPIVRSPCNFMRAQGGGAVVQSTVTFSLRVRVAPHRVDFDAIPGARARIAQQAHNLSPWPLELLMPLLEN
jgi:hypothetical protein